MVAKLSPGVAAQIMKIVGTHEGTISGMKANTDGKPTFTLLERLDKFALINLFAT